MRLVVLVCIAAFSVACDDLLQPSDVGGVLLRTDASAYTIAETDRAFEADIPFTFTNATGETVYVPNCLGMAPPVLEKRVADEWVLAYVPIVLACLSPPIVIDPDQRYNAVLEVRARKGENDFPKFQTADVEGSHRLVWRAVHDYDDTKSGFGRALPLEHRISNEFLLTLD